MHVVSGCWSSLWLDHPKFLFMLGVPVCTVPNPSASSLQSNRTGVRRERRKGGDRGGGEWRWGSGFRYREAICLDGFPSPSVSCVSQEGGGRGGRGGGGWGCEGCPCLAGARQNHRVSLRFLEFSVFLGWERLSFFFFFKHTRLDRNNFYLQKTAVLYLVQQVNHLYFLLLFHEFLLHNHKQTTQPHVFKVSLKWTCAGFYITIYFVCFAWLSSLLSPWSKHKTIPEIIKTHRAVCSWFLVLFNCIILSKPTVMDFQQCSLSLSESSWH